MDEKARQFGRFVLSIFKYHKRKLLVVFLSALLTAFLMFPYEDLSDKVTEVVALATQNKVFIQSNDLSIGIFPGLSVKLAEVTIDTPYVPTIEASQLRISPSIFSSLSGNPAGSAKVTGFLNSELYASISSGKETSEGVKEQEIELDIESLSLKQLQKFLDIPYQFSGTGNLELNSNIDPSFRNEPDGEFSLTIEDLTIPNQSVPTLIGPLVIPNFKFKTAVIKGRLIAKELIIEEATFGSQSEPIFLQFKLKMGLRFGPNFQPSPSNYTLKINLMSKGNALKDLALFLTPYDKYKRATNDGVQYYFQLSGSPTGAPKDSNITKF